MSFFNDNIIHIKKYTLPFQVVERELKNKMLLVEQSLYSLNYFRKKNKTKQKLRFIKNTNTCFMFT